MPSHGQGLSLAGVITWARTRFKEDFVKIPKSPQFSRETIHLPGSAKPVESVIIGTAFEEVRPYFRATTNVLAWLDHDRVDVGYMFHDGSKTSAIIYHDLTDSRIDFHEPFSWILEAGDETAFRRFEAFVQYAVLTRKGPHKGVRPGAVSDFREHFPGACRGIAEVANQRLTEWNRITAPLDPGESEPWQRDADLTDLPHDTIASTPPPARNEFPDSSPPAMEIEAQNGATVPTYHSPMLTEYTDAVAALTRKMNTITRLHAREKNRLQARIKNLETSVTLASKNAIKVKKEIKKAQEKAKAAQDKVKKVQQEKRSALAAETNRMREDVAREAETGAEGLRLRAEIQRLERMVIIASSNTAQAKKEVHKAKEQRAATNKICANQQNEIGAWKNKHGAMAERSESMRQLAVTWETEYKTLRASVDNALGASI